MRHPLCHISCILLGGLSFGCASGTTFEDELTISQGVAGFLVQGCSGSDCEEEPIGGAEVRVYPADTMLGAPGEFPTEPLLGNGTSSEDEGFYEIELEPGSYVLLLNPELAATEVELGEGVKDCSYKSGSGGGSWTCGELLPR